jgi:hypothetical protein
MRVTPYAPVVGARLAAIVGMGILWGTTVTSAQMTRDPREHARSHLGPFYVTPTLELFEVGVETNVFNEPEGKSDLTSTLLPHADVWVPFGRRALITASGTLGLIYYQTYATERSVNPDARLRGDLRVSRVTLFASSAYANSRRQPNLEIDARARHVTRGVDAGVEAHFTERLSLELGASRADIAFEDDAVYQDTSLRDTLNRRMRSGWASARYDLTPLTRINLRGQFTEERFPFSPIRDADSLSLVPGVEFQPRALISGAASVGIRRFQPRSTRLPSYTGPVASANLSYALRGTTRFRFRAIHDLAYSYSEIEPYYAIAGYGLAITQYLGGRFDLTAGGDWQQYRYRRLSLLPADVGTPPVQPPANVNTFHIWSAGLGYRLWRTQRLGFGATYREREASNEPDRAYSGLRVMVTVNSGL